MKIFALVDCNNFFVSCERVFDASIRRRPVVVLSNNDGCVISRSNEAKLLGIKMGEPFFKCRDLCRRYGVKVFSSNFKLYGDISSRIMTILTGICPQIQYYSIDEAFLQIQDIQDLEFWAKDVRNKILQYTGIPVSVGLARTKTLAKAANEITKKNNIYQGVLDLSTLDQEAIDRHLKTMNIEDIWGVGRGFKQKFINLGIRTAFDFSSLKKNRVSQLMKSSGERIWLELNQIACLSLNMDLKLRKSVICSRSFGKPVKSLKDLEEAISSYVDRGARKLRKQKLLAKYMRVYCKVKDPRENRFLHMRAKTIELDRPSYYSPYLIGEALQILRSIYVKGDIYKKAGICFYDLQEESSLQFDIFGEIKEENLQKETQLMSLHDQVKNKYGDRAMFFASEGVKQSWKMRTNKISQEFTSNWKELLRVN